MDWDSFTPADWGRLPRMAKAEGVAPLMYHAFERSNIETLHVPTEALGRFGSSRFG